MPLPPAALRAPMHAREVVRCGYRRTDGLWDIEARLTDRKGYAVHTIIARWRLGACFMTWRCASPSTTRC
jgi:hypothetical protein